MKRKIRRAFENITPNVLISVLGHVQRPERAKTKPKKIIPWKQYLTTAAAVLLLFAVGYGGAAILTGGESGIGVSKPQQPTDNLPSNYITEDQAVNIALADMYANEKRDDFEICNLQARLITGNKYWVTFFFNDASYLGSVHYSYTVNAKTGRIDKMSIDGSRNKKDVNEIIPWITARDAALNHAGVSIENLTGLEIELRDEGDYRIDFRDGTYEYDYHIDAFDSRVLNRLLENDDEKDTSNNKYESQQDSVKRALTHAGVPCEDLYFLECSSEHTPNSKTRTVMFVANDTEYEVMIDLKDNTVINNPNSTYVSYKKALNAAVTFGDMSIRLETISDISIELTEHFNEKPIYKIEITADGIGYWAIIDAATGEVNMLSKEGGDHDAPTFGFTNIALGSKNISKLDLSYLETEYNEEKSCYDVTFTLDNVTNTISVFEHVREPDSQTTEPPATEEPTEPNQPDFVIIPDKTIGAEGAITAALADLKIDRSDVMYESVTLEEDDGLAYYEVKFLYKGFLYECDVNFVSGKVTGWDKEEIEPDEVEMNLSKSLDKEIRDAFYMNYTPGNNICLHNSDELTVEYYGEYDDAHVVMVNGILSYDDGSVTRNVAGIPFTFPTSQELLVYADGEFMNLEQAYENDILDYEDIVYLHMNYTK